MFRMLRSAARPFRRVARRVRVTFNPPRHKPEGPWTHREIVGGHWDVIGPLQFDYVVGQGLQPHHVFLDIACGSLRGGRFFIQYLEPGHYLGIDRDGDLIRHGVEAELGRDVVDAKRPEFLVSSRFEFDRFSKIPDYSLAQSLFTHLSPGRIMFCLRRLRKFVRTGHILLATFWEGDGWDFNPFWGYRDYFYPRSTMERLGRKAGFEPTYLGEWNHPRDQRMIRYEAI